MLSVCTMRPSLPRIFLGITSGFPGTYSIYPRGIKAGLTCSFLFIQRRVKSFL